MDSLSLPLNISRSIRLNFSLKKDVENAGAFPRSSAQRYLGTDMAKFSFSEIEDAFLFVSSAMYGIWKNRCGSTANGRFYKTRQTSQSDLGKGHESKGKEIL